MFSGCSPSPCPSVRPPLTANRSVSISFFFLLLFTPVFLSIDPVDYLSLEWDQGSEWVQWYRRRCDVQTTYMHTYILEYQYAYLLGIMGSGRTSPNRWTVSYGYDYLGPRLRAGMYGLCIDMYVWYVWNPARRCGERGGVRGAAPSYTYSSNSVGVSLYSLTGQDIHEAEKPR